MIRSLFVVLMVMLLGLAVEAKAEVQRPQFSAFDPRIKSFVYSPNMIYAYTGYFGYQSSIEFAYDEQIEQIAMGDNSGWQITPAGHRMFLKPISEDATTNMTVFTNKHIYYFELYSDEADGLSDPRISYVTQFVYPDDESEGAFRQYVHDTDKKDLDQVLENPQDYNFNYTVTGSHRIAPVKIFDDGQFTYLQFKNKNADIPAIFQVNKYKDEALINYRVTDNYVVIERVASQFTLRMGDYVACIFNESDPLEGPKED